jgi:hypothetical protein
MRFIPSLCLTVMASYGTLVEKEKVMTVCNRKILNIQVTRDHLDRFFDIGLHSSRETPILFNIGFFGCVLWISFFDTIN